VSVCVFFFLFAHVLASLLLFVHLPYIFACFFALIFSLNSCPCARRSYRCYMGTHLFKLPLFSTICKVLGHFPVYFLKDEDGKFGLNQVGNPWVDDSIHVSIWGSLCVFSCHVWFDSSYSIDSMQIYFALMLRAYFLLFCFFCCNRHNRNRRTYKCACTFAGENGARRRKGFSTPCPGRDFVALSGRDHEPGCQPEHPQHVPLRYAGYTFRLRCVCERAR